MSFFFYKRIFRFIVSLIQIFIFYKQRRQRYTLFLQKKDFIIDIFISLPEISLKKFQKEIDKINKKNYHY